MTATFLTTHEARVGGVILIFLAVAIWTAVQVRRWSDRTIRDAYTAAGVAFDKHADEAVALGNELGDLDCYEASAVVALRPFFAAWDQAVKEDAR